MNKTIIYQVILLLVLGSCKNNGQWQDKYVETLESYPSNLSSHFPKKANLKVDFTSQLFYLSVYAPLHYNIKQSETTTTIDSLISISNLIPHSDTSYYVVNKHLRTDNLLGMPQNYDKYEIQKFVKGAVPIPNFLDSQDFKEENPHLLKDSYLIYLIEASTDKCCDEKFHKGNWHMPERWEDGYSKGYAINEEENEVIYWFVVW